MTASAIAATLGGAHRSGAWWRCVCPSHGSRTGRGATLALRDGECGLIAVCHAGCAPRDVFVVAPRGEVTRSDLDTALSDLSPERQAKIRFLDLPVVSGSATEIRHRLAAGHSVRYLVPEPVYRYIGERGLYRG